MRSREGQQGRGERRTALPDHAARMRNSSMNPKYTTVIRTFGLGTRMYSFHWEIAEKFLNILGLPLRAVTRSEERGSMCITHEPVAIAGHTTVAKTPGRGQRL